MKLIGIAGTIASQSYNKMLLSFIQKHFPDINLEIVDIKDVPLFSEDLNLADYPIISQLNRKILASDGVILATPEHNHTTTPALKSLIEWLSSKVHPFNDKPVLLVGASYYTQGTSRAQTDLRQILESPGVNALVMPKDEFLLGNAKNAFDEAGNLTDARTVAFLETVMKDFTHWIKVLKAMRTKEVPSFEAEDLSAKNPIDTTIVGIDSDDPQWVEKAAELTHAASGNDYVKLDRGVLTVDQLNWFLNSMPFELTYADDNNQFLYYNHFADAKDMLAPRTPDQAGSSLQAVHPARAIPGAKKVINTLRNGKSEYKMLIPGTSTVHYYKRMEDENKSYRGINEIVLDLKPVVDFYLQATGQKLVADKTADVVTGASQKESPAVKPTPKADSVTSASTKEENVVPVIVDERKETQVDSTTSASTH